MDRIIWRADHAHTTDKKSASFLQLKRVKKRFADQMGSVVMTTLTISRIHNGFDNAERHTSPQNAKRIPQAPHKNHMGHIPDPLKIKWKHCLASLKPVYASAGVNSCSAPSSAASSVSTAATTGVSGSRGFNSASLGKTGR
jgi:hypothetical protein